MFQSSGASNCGQASGFFMVDSETLGPHACSRSSNSVPNAVPSTLKHYPPHSCTSANSKQLASCFLCFYHFQVRLRERRVLTDLIGLCDPNPKIIPTYFNEILLWRLEGRESVPKPCLQNGITIQHIYNKCLNTVFSPSYSSFGYYFLIPNSGKRWPCCRPGEPVVLGCVCAQRAEDSTSNLRTEAGCPLSPPDPGALQPAGQHHNSDSRMAIPPPTRANRFSPCFRENAVS